GPDCSYLDDPLLCLVGACVAGVCGAQPAPEGAPCQDSLFCSGGDVCMGGVCVAGTLPVCDDGDACTRDVCDEDADSCAVVSAEGPAGDATCADGMDNDCDGETDDLDTDCAGPSCPEGTACDDGVYCNGADRCQSSACLNVGPAPCSDDGRSCTLTCDEGAQACNTLMAGFCLIGSTCYADGAPNPSNPCQECIPSISATSFSNDDSNTCVVGDFCDGTDMCVAGTCMGGGPPPCSDDGLACTVTCDEAADACNVPVPGSCLIGGFCRSDGEPDPANPCQECVSASDPFGWTPDDSNPCADAFSCTVDTCSSGTCTSGPGPCGPGEVCVPQCFGGATGCGLPPGSMTLSCPSPAPALAAHSFGKYPRRRVISGSAAGRGSILPASGWN
ncbi:MAG: hypothetical protein ACRDH5_12870, partial [bacterium]